MIYRNMLYVFYKDLLQMREITNWFIQNTKANENYI